ncbi:MAG: T9SS type A sorting domain-containing protein [Prevotella sp.]|nr:T9SS type A sorting domain-containing protein [Prevotella sp.]
MVGSKACGVREVRVIGMQGEYDPTVMYQWPTYPDVMNYDFRNDYPNGFPAPTKALPENVGQVGSRTKGWWTFAWGKNRSKYVTDEAIDSLLSRMDHDFRFFREEMGWLPDKRAKNGYYSTIYLYGSGLTTDDADSTALGGWQGTTWYDNQSWPMVHLSYYPVACFDPNFTYDGYQNRSVTDQAFQTGACVHEGIHAMLADLDGCKKSVWFHESSDNWLMSEAEQRRQNISTPTSMGFLSAGSVIAPFMPIDCYSGWLQDGSFGGPTADGVNMYGDKGQLCTWRTLLGGVQYSEYFPNALSQMLGNGSIPWIWQNCRDYILESMGKALGDENMRSLLVEYNARRAMVDVGKWNTAITNLLDNNWLLDIGPEGNAAGGNWMDNIEHWRATCYAKMSKCDEVDSAGWWKPEYRTTPGWSAANQIPLHVESAVGNIVRIYFKPIGQNMTCQLCFRSKRGKVYYSHPVSGEGIVSMELKEVPANGVVVAVVSNTDYVYLGEATRKAHHDYRLKMMDNVYQPAEATLKWYKYRYTITDPAFVTGVSDVTVSQPETGRFTMTPEKTMVKRGEQVGFHFTGVTRPWVQVRMHTISGKLVYAQSFRYDGKLLVPDYLSKGLYIVESQDGSNRASIKLVVE